MKQKGLDINIPNWSMFGVTRAVVNVFKKEHEGGVLYTSALLIWLNDGVEVEEGEEKTITIFTDVVLDDPKKCAMIVAEYASSLFNELTSYVYVFGDDGEIIDEFDLNDIPDDELPELNFEDYDFEDLNKKVIH